MTKWAAAATCTIQVVSRNPEDGTITEVTRRAVFDFIAVEKVDWSGRLEEPDFLGRIWPVEEMRSTDGRFKTAAEDIWQHRVRNWDWEDDWILTDVRFNLLRGPDEEFVRFLAEMVHPVVRSDETEVGRLVEEFNAQLRRDNWELMEVKQLSGRPVFEGHRQAAFRVASEVVAAEKYTDLLDPGVLNDHLKRIDRDLVSDPPGAIAASKELVESVLKAILERRGVQYKRSADLMELYKLVQKELGLNAQAVPESAPGSRAAVGTLRALVSTVQSLAELRNAIGLGHGGNDQSKALTRHARLAFNACIAVTEFLLETWRDRES